jgi:biopolymer transport protein ExbB
MWHWFVKGGPVMWPLLFCSVIALGVILERVAFWLQERRTQDTGLVHKLLHLTERGLFDEVAAAAQARAMQSRASSSTD